MSYLDQLRMANIFGGGGGNPFDPPRQESPLRLLDQFIRRLPKPPLIDYASMKQQPTPPGSINLIKPEKPQNVVYQPALSPFQQAQLQESERDRESRERVAELYAGSREKIAEGTQGIRRDELEVRRQLAEIAQFKAEHPNVKIITQRGGDIFAIDSLTGMPVRNFGSSGMLNDTEKIALEGAQRVELAREQGAQARKTEEVRGENAMDVTRERGRQARQTVMTRATSHNLPTQQRVAVFNRAQQIKAQYPEFAKYINLLPGNIVELKAPKTGFMARLGGGISKEDYDRMVNLIFADSKPSTSYIGEDIPEEPENEEFQLPGMTTPQTTTPRTTKPGDPLGIRR